MIKVLYFNLVIFISVTLFSCAILSDISNVQSKNKETKIPGNVKIYIYNRTIDNETINVYNQGNFAPVILLERIPKGGEQMLNITSGSTIYINGAETGRQYREIICNKDQEKIYIY